MLVVKDVVVGDVCKGLLGDYIISRGVTWGGEGGREG